MKRIGIMQLLQESNSFNPVLTTEADFEILGVGLGPEVLSRFGQVDEVGGFLEGLKKWQMSAEPVGLLRAQAISGGPLSPEAKESFLGIIRQQLGKAGRLDGLLFAMHGAMVAEDEYDMEGLFLEEVRRIVGPEVPIALTVDLHAYVTSRMTEFADAVVAYHTLPHVDRQETGERAANVLERILSGAKPAYATVKLPMITIAEGQDARGNVMGPVFERVGQLENQSDVLSTGVLMTQGWLDVPGHGWSTMVITDGKPELATKLAVELAEMCWQRRNAIAASAELYSAADSVARALACTGKPVVIADGADATNSGACGDSVHLLQAMMDKKIPDGALTIMVDPEAVAHAKQAGAGSKFKFAVGGKRDHLFSKPLEVSGQVMSLQPAKYVLSGHWGNFPVDMGMSAAVKIDDVTLLLVEFAGPGSSPSMYRCVGLEPKDFKIVVVKSPAGFRADFEPFAAEIILSDCPGCASPRFSELPFRQINRPLWPLDEIDDWHSVEWINEINRSLSYP